MAKLDQLLAMAVEMGASDVHLSVGEPPILRVVGEMRPMRMAPITLESFMGLIGEVLPEHLMNVLTTQGDLDWGYESEGVSRFRVNLFKKEGGFSAVFRVIPSEFATFERLGLPPQVADFLNYSNGLVLVTGPTGSGKSTTLASMIHLLNQERSLHILTIEDPIEFVHQNIKSRITQRELGTSARSFADALRVALREDPDIILVGEMRDLETIYMALQAAETGVLVLATMHTNSAARAVDRLVNVFPADEQDAVRTMFASVLRGILAQQLVPRRQGGRVPAVEVMFYTLGLPHMIREGKVHMIENMIKTGRAKGMIAMDDSLMDLVKREEVEPEMAYSYALNKEMFQKSLSKELGITINS